MMAYIWHAPYLLSYAGFIITRAIYDVSESMLLEILWLTFAMAWGTIKVWDTRAAASWNYDGYNFTLNQKISEENSWGFGQTLPLILLLLPLLSMAQAYLDDDAKAQEASRVNEDTLSPLGTAATEETEDPSAVDPDPFDSENCRRLVNLPTYPYENFASHDWYHDHLVLLVSQIIMVSTVALFFLTRLADIFGISSILRSRLFVIWILAILPLASFIHLAAWYFAALVVGKWPDVGRRLSRENEERRDQSRRGQVVHWIWRAGLIAGCLLFTFFVSLESAGPNSLFSYLR
ncbi:hypothetical protein J4E93_009279 [Alternaria ventricosa]|uniref:uncharacterized protein n=1 Tax=Alternaria ventricosa TaxID=1187951 RepID=UPI0020C5112F|nr:uncharacterized protein J4E93_009279 [Alternaria ventricosa]KAI4639451.1 hypothetical protein J4E93_009279 [Alternaria ventricosa]